jgi:tetratricopeptide (TPR) repeat protein
MSLLEEALKADDAAVPPCQKARAEAARGRLQYRQEERDSALATLKRAAALCPERGEGTLALVDHLLDVGQFEEARATMDRQQRAGAAAHELSLRRARLAQLTSRAEEGIEALASAPQEDPRVHWLRGQLYMDMGDHERAARAFDSGAERDPMLGAQVAWSKLALARKAGKPDGSALDVVDLLANKAEQSAQVQRAAGLMRLMAAQGERDATRRQDMLAQAKKRLDAAARLAPDDAQVLYDLCQLQLARRNKEAALATCEDAMARGDKYVPGMLYVAQMRLQRGEWEQSEALLKALQEAHPQDLQIGAMLVRTYIVGSRLGKAQETLDGWLKEPGAKTSQFKLLQGLIAFNMRDFAAAQGYLQQAAELDPSDAEAAIFVAYAKLRMGEQGAPVEDVLKAQLRHPQWGGFAWLALGELRRRQGRFQDAEENLAQALTTLQEGMTPPWMIGDAYLQRALAWQAKHGWGHERVKQHLNDAAGQGDSGSAELAYVRGLYMLNQKKPQLEAAAEEFERSLSVAPKSCATLQALALTYTKLKRNDDLDRVNDAQKSLKCEQ